MIDKRAGTWLVSGGVVAVSALFGLLCLAVIGYETGPMGFLLGLVMAVVPVPFYLAFALWIDRFEPEPPLLLALAFVWGAAIATFAALVMNTIASAVLGVVAGQAAASLSSILSAPFVEETAKGFALLLLCWWQRDEFDNVTDGIVYATMIGLGFAMTENVQYYGRAVAQNGVGAIGVFVVRGIMGPFCHPLFTSMTGIGFGIARETRNRAAKILAPLFGLACAMGLHFLWNLSANLGVMFFLTYLAIMVPAFIAVLTVAVISMVREARIIRVHLESVAAAGVLSHEDLAILCSLVKRFRASTNALMTGGLAGWRARRNFERVATDVAFRSWRWQLEEHREADGRREPLLAELREARAALHLPPVDRPAVPIVRPPFGSLLCTAGPLAGRQFALRSEGCLIGRDPASSQIVVQDPRVSKRHVWIGMKNGTAVAVDYGSTNGTYLNSYAEKVKEVPLHSGDTIILSNDVARFEFRA